MNFAFTHASNAAVGGGGVSWRVTEGTLRPEPRVESLVSIAIIVIIGGRAEL